MVLRFHLEVRIFLCGFSVFSGLFPEYFSQWAQSLEATDITDTESRVTCYFSPVLPIWTFQYDLSLKASTQLLQGRLSSCPCVIDVK